MSGAPPPPRRRLHKSSSASGGGVNAVKQKHALESVAPPERTFSVPEPKKVVTLDRARSFDLLPDTEREDRDEAMDKLAHASQSKYLYQNDPQGADYEFLLDEVPETSVGEGVDIKGELQFETLLRIDGTFEGTLDSTDGSVVIGRTGCLIGNVKGMNTLIIDGGKMIGDIQVQRLAIRGTGYLRGTLAAKTLSIGPHCTVIGNANIHSLAPEVVDSNGDIIVDEADFETGALEDPESAYGEVGEYLGELEGEEAMNFEVGEGGEDGAGVGEGEGEGEGEKKSSKKSKKHHSKKSKKEKGEEGQAAEGEG